MSETSQKFSTESHGSSLPLTDRRLASLVSVAADDDDLFVVICGNKVGLFVKIAVCGRRIISSQKEQTMVWVLRSPMDGKLSMDSRESIRKKKHLDRRRIQREFYSLEFRFFFFLTQTAKQKQTKGGERDTHVHGHRDQNIQRQKKTYLDTRKILEIRKRKELVNDCERKLLDLVENIE